MAGGAIAAQNTPSLGSVTRLRNASLIPLLVGSQAHIHAGQSKSKLNSEFADIRNRFKGRYIRLYGACDRANY